MTTKIKNTVFVLAISLVMAVLRTVIVVTNMEKGSPRTDTYYLPQNTVVVAFTVATVVLLAVFAFIAFRFAGRARVELDDRSAAVSIGALVLSFALIGAEIVYVWTLFSDSALNASQTLLLMGTDGNSGFSLVELFTTIFASASAVKFFIQGLHNGRNKKHNASVAAMAALLPIFFSAFRLLNDFINSSAAPLASSGAYHIVSIVAVLLFFLTEGKAYVYNTKSVLYDIYGYFSVYLLLIYAIPNVIIHCFGIFSFDADTLMSIVDIGIAVYISTRLCTAKKLRPKKQEAVTTE